MKLDDLIGVYHNVVEPSECARIIEAFEARIHLTQDHDTPGYKFLQLDCNETDLKDLAWQFVGHVEPYLRAYIKELGLEEFLEIKAFENVRIKKYRAGSDDRFKIHIDAANRESAVRTLVFILYLNDNDGETAFPMVGRSVKPKAGSLVVFPPFWMFPHVGQPPTTGDKFIMMSAVHHP